MDYEKDNTTNFDYQFMDHNAGADEDLWDRLDREEEAFMEHPDEALETIGASVRDHGLYAGQEDIGDDNDETMTNVLRELGMCTPSLFIFADSLPECSTSR